jgi:hypothetical protein
LNWRGSGRVGGQGDPDIHWNGITYVNPSWMDSS